MLTRKDKITVEISIENAIGRCKLCTDKKVAGKTESLIKELKSLTGKIDELEKAADINRRIVECAGAGTHKVTLSHYKWETGTYEFTCLACGCRYEKRETHGLSNTEVALVNASKE